MRGKIRVTGKGGETKDPISAETEMEQRVNEMERYKGVVPAGQFHGCGASGTTNIL